MSWEIIKVYSAVCDVPGCDETEDFVPARSKGLRDARVAAKREGWTVDGGDAMRCPKHNGPDA